MPEAAALHDLARAVDASGVVARLEGLTGSVEGPRASAGCPRGALAADDAPGLEDASTVFESVGALLVAAEVASDAAVVWRRRGSGHRAAAGEGRAARLAAQCQGRRHLPSRPSKPVPGSDGRATGSPVGRRRAIE